MSKHALALDVCYLRDGERPGHMFVSRRDGDLELTTPLHIIRISQEQALELWTEIQRLYGWKTGAP